MSELYAPHDVTAGDGEVWLLNDGRKIRAVPADKVRVTYGRKHRTKKVRDTPIGRIREVEEIGVDRASFWLSEAAKEYGRRLLPHNMGFKRRDTKLYARVLPEGPEVHELARHDRYVASLEARLKKAREQRQEFLDGTFERAESVNGMTLDELAAAADARAAEVRS